VLILARREREREREREYVLGSDASYEHSCLFFPRSFANPNNKFIMLYKRYIMEH